jgi:hypothetical protein
MIMLLLSTLIACPAEQLGIEMPEGGAGAVSAEDVQRDVLRLVDPTTDAAAAYAERMEQMRVDKIVREDDRVCGRKNGPGPPRVVVAPWPKDLPSAVQVAMLVSLAKAFDGPVAATRETWLCMGAGPEGEDVALPAPPDVRSAEALDYRVIAAQVGQLYETLEPGRKGVGPSKKEPKNRLDQ